MRILGNPTLHRAIIHFDTYLFYRRRGNPRNAYRAYYRARYYIKKLDLSVRDFRQKYNFPERGHDNHV